MQDMIEQKQSHIMVILVSIFLKHEFVGSIANKCLLTSREQDL